MARGDAAETRLGRTTHPVSIELVRLVWIRPARADRKAIREYVARDNPAAALALDELFSEQTARLVGHPRLGRTGRIIGTRELVAHHNYILIYDTVGDRVRVLRILHAARRWPGP